MFPAAEPRGRIALQLVERDARVLELRERVRARPDVVADQRPVFGEPGRASLERERDLLSLLDLGPELGERGEAERTQGIVEVRGANRHLPFLAVAPDRAGDEMYVSRHSFRRRRTRIHSTASLAPSRFVTSSARLWGKRDANVSTRLRGWTNA